MTGLGWLGLSVSAAGVGITSLQDRARRYTIAFRLFRFQYRYPGTPIIMIAVPQKASVGRVKIVFNVHAVPTST
jgi:hypothetical protein